MLRNRPGLFSLQNFHQNISHKDLRAALYDRQELELAVEPKHLTYSERLQIIGYSLNNVPAMFCDAVSFEFMNEPRVFDPQGRAVDAKNIPAMKKNAQGDYIHPYFRTGIMQFNNATADEISTDKMLAHALKYDLETHQHSEEEKLTIQDYLKKLTDKIKIYDHQQTIEVLLEEFVSTIEKMSSLSAKAHLMEEEYNSSMTRFNIELETFPPAQVQQFLDEQRKQHHDQLMLIHTHLEEVTEKFIKQAGSFLLEQDDLLSEFDEEEHQNTIAFAMDLNEDVKKKLNNYRNDQLKEINVGIGSLFKLSQKSFCNSKFHFPFLFSIAKAQLGEKDMNVEVPLPRMANVD